MKININAAFQIEELCQKLANRVLPARIAYKFAKLLKTISIEAEFYRTQYSLYIEEYGERDENGNLIFTNDKSIKIIPSKLEECKNKFNELNQFEIELPTISFSLEELESLNITMNDILILDPFIEE